MPHNRFEHYKRLLETIWKPNHIHSRPRVADTFQRSMWRGVGTVSGTVRTFLTTFIRELRNHPIRQLLNKSYYNYLRCVENESDIVVRTTVSGSEHNAFQYATRQIGYRRRQEQWTDFYGEKHEKFFNHPEYI